MLKVSTARNVMVFMTDSTDHITGKSGLTLTITASKDGGAFASITPTVTDLGSGWYSLALTTTHTNTKGDLALHITATGADPTDLFKQVVTDLPGDTVASVGSGVTVTTNNDKTGYTVSTVSDKTGYSLATAPPTAAAIRTEIDSNSSQLSAIAAKTVNLPAAPASQGDVTAVGSAVALIPTTPLLASNYTAPDNATISAIAGYIDTEVSAIKAKTDNLPSDPADQSLIISATDAILTRLGVPVVSVSADIASVKSDSSAIKTKTDALPTDPASELKIINTVIAMS